MATTFDPDDYELRWPPQLFVDEANRLLDRRSSAAQRGLPSTFHSLDAFVRGTAPGLEVEWLLTEAFVSTVPMETFGELSRDTFIQRVEPDSTPSKLNSTQWFLQLIREVSTWSEPSRRKPYWSARAAAARGSRPPMQFDEVTSSFVQVVEEFEANGYLAQVFGQICVDDRDRPPLPDRSAILHDRAGYPVADWPLEASRPGWDLDT